MSREIRRFAGDDQVYENGNKIGTANLNLTCTGYVARDNSGNSYGTYNDQMDAAKAIPAPGSESGSSPWAPTSLHDATKPTSWWDRTKP
jgi:hypothetical protein